MFLKKSNHRDLYNATDISQIKWIFDGQKAPTVFLLKNYSVTL
ncbi:hypothetical protein Q787_09565 [Ornithobacterium rhinotracheale H06-030791]|nr:hypothetical protein Q785_09750 [Ornithobacterium rhinotracheale ORT-UMN 88]KGB66323.1 hypothetical protein Q787_09565 [Ornithobacterium rhinotracheale H06-030791]